MRIGELAEKTGLSRDTIRFYERNGLIASEPGDAQTNSYKNYPDDLVPRLVVIQQARDAGMAVAEIRVMLDALNGSCDPADAKRVALAKIAELEDSIRQAEKVIAFLKAQMA